MKPNITFMQRAIELSLIGSESGKGGPFGCVIVKNGKIIAEGHNEVIDQNDPTAHAEVVAIRRACKVLKSFQLTDCEIYTSCEPCPMCLGAIYWARPKVVFYANNRMDAGSIGFDDDFIYQELNIALSERKIPFIEMKTSSAIEAFERWKASISKIEY